MCVGVWVISGNYLVRLWPLTLPFDLPHPVQLKRRWTCIHTYAYPHTSTHLGDKGCVFVRAGSKFWDLTISPVRVIQGGKTWLDYQGMSTNSIKHISQSVLTHSQKQARISFIYFRFCKIISALKHSYQEGNYIPRWVTHRETGTDWFSWIK